MVDGASRFTLKVALAHKSASSVATVFLQHWVSVFGPPRRLHSDQGDEFTNALLARLMAVLGVEKLQTYPTALRPTAT